MPRGQRVSLEGQHLWLVDLICDGAVDPWKPPDPGVQARGQNHGLLDAVGAGVDEVFVEPLGARRGVAPEERQSFGRPRGVPAALGCRVDEELRIAVGEQGAFAIGFSGAHHGHTERRRADALGDVPAVVVGACHNARLVKLQTARSARGGVVYFDGWDPMCWLTSMRVWRCSHSIAPSISTPTPPTWAGC